MLRFVSKPGAALVALALVPTLFLAGSARSAGQEWGTVKGQIVFNGAKVPDNPKANVNQDKMHCLSKGDILKNELVVNKKNKGVRWTLVWLTGVDDPRGTRTIPTHPALAKVNGPVEIDQPCCIFEPRVLGMREGQTLIVKNSSPIAHNTNMNGGDKGPNINPLIPAGGQVKVEKVKARVLPLSYSCSIHGWMKGWIGVFKHPYFAVTDADGAFTIKNAPAGKYRLMAWQEAVGWVIINPKDPKDRGKVIEIKAGGTTDVGKIPLTLPKDE
jgi:hypothetical protein